MAKKPKVLLMDANVLIDYQKSDFSVLGLVNKHVGACRQAPIGFSPCSLQISARSPFR